MNLLVKIGLLFVVYIIVLCSAGSHPDYNHPKVSQSEGNKRFKKCCENNSNIPKKCQALCKYEVSLTEAQDAYKKGDCDVDMLEDYMKCANGGKQGSDNRQCCKDLGAINSVNDPLCSQFCMKNPSFDDLSMRNMKCGRRMKEIMKCHNFGLKP